MLLFRIAILNVVPSLILSLFVLLLCVSLILNATMLSLFLLLLYLCPLEKLYFSFFLISTSLLFASDPHPSIKPTSIMGNNPSHHAAFFGGTPDVNRQAWVRRNPNGSRNDRRRQERAPKGGPSARRSGPRAPSGPRQHPSQNMSHYEEDEDYYSGDDVSGPQGEEVPVHMSAPKGFRGGGRGRGDSMVGPPSQHPSHQRQLSRPHDSHLALRHSGSAGGPGPDPRRGRGHSMNAGPGRSMNDGPGRPMNRGPGRSMNRGPSLSLRREGDDDRSGFTLIEPPRGMSNQPRRRQRAATSRHGSQRGERQ